MAEPRSCVFVPEGAGIEPGPCTPAGMARATTFQWGQPWRRELAAEGQPAAITELMAAQPATCKQMPAEARGPMEVGHWRRERKSTPCKPAARAPPSLCSWVAPDGMPSVCSCRCCLAARQGVCLAAGIQNALPLYLCITAPECIVLQCRDDDGHTCTAARPQLRVDISLAPAGAAC